MEPSCWYEITIQDVPRDKVEDISDHLETLNTLSITLTDDYDDEPVLEPAPGAAPLWPVVNIKALFSDESSAFLALSALKNLYPAYSYFQKTIVEENWQEKLTHQHHAVQFGDKLWICPSWDNTPNNGVMVTLDPGMAFGTGQHPTTRLCLEWLANNNLEQLDIVDYGCGSGILAIAAIKLGAKNVAAYDIDEQALIATENNRLLNKIDSNSFEIYKTDSLIKLADIVVANILLNPLLELRDRFRSLVHESGSLVVSGILKEQTDELIHHYAPVWQVQAIKEEGDWALIHFC